MEQRAREFGNELMADEQRELAERGTPGKTVRVGGSSGGRTISLDCRLLHRDYSEHQQREHAWSNVLIT